ncbi:hypothetical protein [Streptomyces sp. CAI-85]|uniref:hypothetical protein n=1 Tax=Streptomyces sp. CAI-85 TaxID=1472662 RepID=UPI001587F70C|nr:hypothetical protein [Streptomyces sp. CAI-85]NUV64307.1 hypothetical protein [Streptomyces sp. CAI-85]
MILSIARLAARTVTTIVTVGRDTVVDTVRQARTVVEDALAEGERVVAGPAVDPEDAPTAEEIAEAAEAHEIARESYNEGSRGKRAARKTLDRAVTGIYNGWAVKWVQSSRREWDRDAIAAVFAELGREIPTRPAAPTLKLSRVVVEDQDAPELLAA